MGCGASSNVDQTSKRVGRKNNGSNDFWGQQYNAHGGARQQSNETTPLRGKKNRGGYTRDSDGGSTKGEGESGASGGEDIVLAERNDFGTSEQHKGGGRKAGAASTVRGLMAARSLAVAEERVSVLSAISATEVEVPTGFGPRGEKEEPVSEPRSHGRGKPGQAGAAVIVTDAAEAVPSSPLVNFDTLGEKDRRDGLGAGSNEERQGGLAVRKPGSADLMLNSIKSTEEDSGKVDHSTAREYNPDKPKKRTTFEEGGSIVSRKGTRSNAEEKDSQSNSRALLANAALSTNELAGEDELRDVEVPVRKSFQLSADDLAGPTTCSELENEEGTFEENFSVLDTLGKGSFSTVKKAVEKTTGKVYAAKIVQKKRADGSEVPFKELWPEIQVLRVLDHPRIVRLHHVYEGETELVFVIDYAEGGELYDRVVEKKVFSEGDAANVMKDLLSALSYLHSRKIAHRDIKLENLLLRDKSPNSPVLLGDFGFAKYSFNDGMMKTMCGSPVYVAPEVIGGPLTFEPAKKKGYDLRCDMWSAGIILYVLLCGYAPFLGRNVNATMRLVRRGVYSFPDREWAGVSDEAKNLVRSLLKLDPEKRLTADEALHHVWIKERAKKRRGSLMTGGNLAQLRSSIRNMQNY
eukprot:CAMPEP_0113869670 /NCGR_PEP_ID=MMETSP0780_2-20120614/1664_1 /TAXON_ID=652834 /ORGANISM="Palpitomonas bilix" /LENGTH=633 /DNA_ID=CAMNT_0000854871 /DNA_START=139 /DNA_END=2040 /DNA_ORIENTATION=+ /assembly_acc=CAM_ASM_000599